MKEVQFDCTIYLLLFSDYLPFFVHLLGGNMNLCVIFSPAKSMSVQVYIEHF